MKKYLLKFLLILLVGLTFTVSSCKKDQEPYYKTSMKVYIFGFTGDYTYGASDQCAQMISEANGKINNKTFNIYLWHEITHPDNTQPWTNCREFDFISTTNNFSVNYTVDEYLTGPSDPGINGWVVIECTHADGTTSKIKKWMSFRDKWTISVPCKVAYKEK